MEDNESNNSSWVVFTFLKLHIYIITQNIIYSDQLIDLQWKSIDQFLYNRKIGLQLTNAFLDQVPILYPLKTPEKTRTELFAKILNLQWNLKQNFWSNKRKDMLHSMHLKT